VNAGNFDVGGVVGKEENRAVVFIVRIQNLCAREAIPPLLTISVKHARAVDLDVPRYMSDRRFRKV